MRPRGAFVLVVATLVGVAGCGSPAPKPDTPGAAALVVVSAPITSDPWVGQSVARGAQLAADEVNSAPAASGSGSPAARVRIDVMDNGGSASKAVSDARSAVARGAAAFVTDGIGAQAVAQVSDAHDLPVFVVFDGGDSFVDPAKYPTIFRLAPADKYMSRRLADYMADKAHSVALISDDSSYGRDGARRLGADLAHDELKLAAKVELPAGAVDVTAQVLAARRSGADALVVWSGPQIVARVIRAARAAGWPVRVFAGPTAEDPLVRQQLADHPGWLDGTTFVSFRITSEQGPAPFERFRAAYEAKFGPDRIGITAAGRPVVQPPDWAMNSHDAVLLVSAALTQNGGRPGESLIRALDQVSIVGANGDQRSYGPQVREGVSSGDMYFARFADMRFAPVTDDLLSAHLGTVAQ